MRIAKFHHNSDNNFYVKVKFLLIGKNSCDIGKQLHEGEKDKNYTFKQDSWRLQSKDIKDIW